LLIVASLFLQACIARPDVTPGPEARRGIEGEPIPLDSKNSRYRDYLDRVRRMIEAKWRYPCVKDRASGKCEYKDATLTIEFGISQDGRVAHVTVRESSRIDVYDEAIVNAIKAASPFPPVPAELMARTKPGSAFVNFHTTVKYRMMECGEGAACD
jgi:protein TonB